MLKSVTFLYVVLFSVFTNCFLLFNGMGWRIACTVLFVILNLCCGLWICGSKSLRLRFLCHGTTALTAFCGSVVVSLVLHGVAYFKVIEVSQTTLTHSAIYCVLANAIVFWNGIISVYLTSVQLGIKLRVVGYLCGLIPVVNLVVLGIILAKTYGELATETEKEQVNRGRKEQKICQTKYPILLVHGVFYRDNKVLNYWGRIPGELEANGATCYYGNHQSASSVRDSAKELSRRIRDIIEDTGCEKVNIIAHSKGGLDCRYAIAHYGMAEYVASLTTINTPHRGCAFADWLLEKAPDSVKRKISTAYNSVAKKLGDIRPDFMEAVGDLTAEACAEFDKNTEIPEEIYTQSVGSVMHKARSGKFPLNLSYHFVKLFDGKNDGLVGIDSFAWGSRYTLLDMPMKRGISHADMIDLNRENLKGFDVREFYVGLVAELKEMGL